MKKIIVGALLGLPLLLIAMVFAFPVQTGQWVYDNSLALEARVYGFSEQLIPIEGMTLSVYRNNQHLGADKPSVLMLHGYSADKSVWLRFARHLSSDFNIIIPDMAGHGDTGFDQSWSFSGPAQAARLVSLLDRLQIQRVHVIGNSMGGFIAAHFAQAYPDRALTMTLVDPAGVTSPEKSMMENMLAEGKNPFQVDSLQDFRSFYAMTMAKPPFVPDFVIQGVAERYIQRKKQLGAIFDDFHGMDPLDGLLSTINTPALIMWGQQDQLIHVSSVDVWHKGLPVSEVKVWSDIGHMPMVEIPEESAAVYREFLEKYSESNNNNQG